MRTVFVENYFQKNLSVKEINQISNLSLALVGDGVYELMCRTFLCTKGDHNVLHLHKDTVNMVNATAQARFADKLLPALTEEELAFYRRGKNAHTHAAPKAATRQDYAKATGLECLFGALYLQGKTDRLNELFAIIVDN